MQAFRSRTTFIVIAVLTVLAALPSLFARIAVEKSNRAVAIVVDGDAVETLCAAQGITVEEGVKRLKDKGLTGLVLNEQSVTELIADGRAEVKGATLSGTSATTKSLICADKATADRVVKGLGIRFGNLARGLEAREGRISISSIDINSARSTSIGLDPALADLAKKQNLFVVARCANPVGIRPEAIDATLTWAHDLGAGAFLALGEQVLGRRDEIDATADSLRKNSMLYISPEFVKLGGDPEMLALMADRAVRLHSAQSAELDKLSEGAAIERFRKAAAERNMRILLLRPFSSASAAPLDGFGDFIGKLRSELAQDGLTAGLPVPFEGPKVPKIVTISVALLAAAAGLWVAVQLFAGQRGLIVGGVGALAIVGLALKGDSGLALAALLISLIFPIGAGIILVRGKMPAWQSVLAGALLSMVGGICVAALLNSIPYYVRGDQFVGVKAQVFLPIFVLGLVAFTSLCDWRGAMKSPITWGTAALGMGIVGALFLMMLRTGNDNPNAVSGAEVGFRGFLESLMPVRPRTKEFALGFPALFAGIAMLRMTDGNEAAQSKWNGWAALGIMLGGIGLTDVVNTLTHLHTPLTVSLMRNGFGIVLGLIFGALLWLVLKPFAKRAVESVGNSNG